MRLSPLCHTALATIVLVTPPAFGHAQDACSAPAAPGLSDSSRTRTALNLRIISALRLSGRAPRIDGRLDEQAWCLAQPATDFVQSSPAPGAVATLPSSARILFDDDAIYVALRLADPHPDSIVAPYPRRDDETTSDWAFVEIDSRFDRRSGFSFGVNPRGVQADGTWADDVNYDTGWNGVWEVAATIDSAGWSAEFRIPYSQMALARNQEGQPLVWGINFYRYTPHRGETSNWSPRLPSVVGVVSHFNQVQGLVVPPRHATFEALPYSALTGTHDPTDPGSVNHDVTWTAGADLRFRPTTSSTAALSIRPDFGQVEADPAEVNLTTFETFLPERRPMFVEGNEVFQFTSGLAFSSRGTSFAQESPFYSRRIGRAPRGSCPSGATHCRIPGVAELAAAIRLSGRTANGWSGGVFDAWTSAAEAEMVSDSGRHTAALVEPRTNFTVLRAVRQLDDGKATLGAMATFAARAGMEDELNDILLHHALVAGMDGRLRFGHDRYEVTGFGLMSRVDGSAGAIATLRPRQPSRASMAGISAQTRLARIDGQFQWGIAGRVVSPTFESNDVGFQRNADWLLAVLDWKYFGYRPGHLIRRWSIGSNQIGVGWDFSGVRRAAVANLVGTLDFRNYWGGSLSLTHEFSAQDPEVLRGGPALLLPSRDRATLGVYSDSRRRWQAAFTLAGEREPGTASSQVRFAPNLSAFLNDRFQVSLGPSVSVAEEAWQYVDQSADTSGRMHYLMGELAQTTTTLTGRATYAFSSRLTIQLYSQIFLSGGSFTRFKEVVNPTAASLERRLAEILPSRLSYDSTHRRYLVDAGRSSEFGFRDPAFSERDLHLNLLLRWEFLPGSTVFIVWTHARSSDGVADFRVTRDLSQLWRAPGVNAVAAKLSYWIGV